MGWASDILRTFVITSGDFADYDEIDDIFNTVMAGLCVLCAGMAAGLTMGLLSLDVTKLEIKCRVGTPQEKKDAEAVLPIVRQHHLLLVTLLLFNSIANETLPIFLGELVPNYIAILLAVSLILVFGEILPSAFFTGVHQLRTSARLIPFVYGLIAVLYPVAYPISKALDHMFGEEEEEIAMTRSELEALVLMQQVHAVRVYTPAIHTAEKVSNDERRHSISGEDPAYSTNHSTTNNYGTMDATEASRLLDDAERGGIRAGSRDEDDKQHDHYAATAKTLTSPTKHKHPEGLSASEVTLMLGVLNLSKHDVGVAMIPLDNVFMVSSANRLDDPQFLHSILRSGFSRIPVYYREDNSHIMGYMLVKELIVSEKSKLLEDFKLREPLFVKPSVGLLEMLGIFQEGQCHLAVVTEDPACAVQHLRAGSAPPSHARVLGLVTLEDVLEKVIQGDITDETDRFGDYEHDAIGSGSAKVVVTTQLARKMSRAHLVSDLLTSAGGVDSTVANGERRRSRSRSRGRSASRANLLALSSINNVVAGDVRHKERDGQHISPTRAVGARLLHDNAGTTHDHSHDHGHDHSHGDRYARLYPTDGADSNTKSQLGGYSGSSEQSSPVEPFSPLGQAAFREAPVLRNAGQRDFFNDVVDTHIHDGESDAEDTVPLKAVRRSNSGHSGVKFLVGAGGSSDTVAPIATVAGEVKPPRGVRTVCIGSPGGTMFSKGERTAARSSLSAAAGQQQSTAPPSSGSPNRVRVARTNSGSRSPAGSPRMTRQSSFPSRTATEPGSDTGAGTGTATGASSGAEVEAAAQGSGRGTVLRPARKQN